MLTIYGKRDDRSDWDHIADVSNGDDATVSAVISWSIQNYELVKLAHTLKPMHPVVQFKTSLK